MSLRSLVVDLDFFNYARNDFANYFKCFLVSDWVKSERRAELVMHLDQHE